MALVVLHQRYINFGHSHFPQKISRQITNWKGPKGIPIGHRENVLKVKKSRAFSGCFQGVCQGAFLVYFPMPFLGTPSRWTLPNQNGVPKMNFPELTRPGCLLKVYTNPELPRISRPIAISGLKSLGSPFSGGGKLFYLQLSFCKQRSSIVSRKPPSVSKKPLFTFLLCMWGLGLQKESPFSACLGGEMMFVILSNTESKKNSGVWRFQVHFGAAKGGKQGQHEKRGALLQTLVALYRAMRLRCGYGFESCDANGPRNVKNTNPAKHRAVFFPHFSLFLVRHWS